MSINLVLRVEMWVEELLAAQAGRDARKKAVTDIHALIRFEPAVNATCVLGNRITKKEKTRKTRRTRNIMKAYNTKNKRTRKSKIRLW